MGPTGLDLASTQASGPDGLKPKPKAKWVRLNRMDFGLGGLTKAITIPSLGKRDSREVQEEQNGVQAIKRGKVSSDDGSMECRSAGVENHPCRE